MRLSMSLRRRAPRVELVSIETPSNAVELNVGTGDPAKEVDGQKVESLDWVWADAWELPVPHDLGAGVQDIKSLDALLGMLGDFSNPLGLGGGGRGVVELEENVSRDTNTVP